MVEARGPGRDGPPYLENKHISWRRTGKSPTLYVASGATWDLAQYAPNLPLVDGDVVAAETIDVPIYARRLEDTATGAHVAATCPACMDEHVFELTHGETVEYRCECGQVLRIVG